MKRLVLLLAFLCAPLAAQIGGQPNRGAPPAARCTQSHQLGTLWLEDATPDVLYECRVEGWVDTAAAGGGGTLDGDYGDFTCVADVCTVGAITLVGDVDGDSGANDLDQAAVETELEGVLDLQDLQGAVTDAQVPDGITVTLAATATALAANGANCSAGSAPLGVDASGTAETCTDYEEDLSNSAGLLAALSDETGTALAVFNDTPTLIDPLVGGVQMCLENGVNCPGGGVGTLEYSPDNYSPAGDTLLSDEFSGDTPTLTWTSQNLDSAVIGYIMDSAYITEAGTTDQWHGATTGVPADSGADWYMVAKITPGLLGSTTRGCGISLVTEGTAASPTEINSIYIAASSGTAGAMVHEDHDDYDFAGTTGIGSSALASTAADTLQIQVRSYYVALEWIDASEDIAAFYSHSGRVWTGLGTDTTVGGYPIASGKFVRDDTACVIEFIRWLDTDVDATTGARMLRVGS